MSETPGRTAGEPKRPLHVRVAEALGWRDCKPCGHRTCPDGFWIGDAPVVDGWVRESHLMPRYDTDWSATGPLIERLGIQIMNLELKVLPTMWSAALSSDHNWALGQTPLVAVCSLILALSAAGKLERGQEGW